MVCIELVSDCIPLQSILMRSIALFTIGLRCPLDCRAVAARRWAGARRAVAGSSGRREKERRRGLVGAGLSLRVIEFNNAHHKLPTNPPEIAMTAPVFDLATTVRHPPDSAALQAADRAVAAALESARADSTNRVYRTQWRSFSSWCSDVGLRPLPADPLTVARYLGVRGEAGVSMATLRQAASAITRVHEWLGAAIAVPGPGRAGIAEGLGPPAGQTPASGRRSDQ